MEPVPQNSIMQKMHIASFRTIKYSLTVEKVMKVSCISTSFIAGQNFWPPLLRGVLSGSTNTEKRRFWRNLIKKPSFLLEFWEKTFIFASFILEPAGEKGGTATYWEASLMLCFWPFERRKLKLVIKDISGGECYGCSIYSRSVPRAIYALTHTFRDALYTWPAWVFKLCSFFTSGFLRPKRGTGRWGYPALSCVDTNNTKWGPLTFGYQSDNATDWCLNIR